MMQMHDVVMMRPKKNNTLGMGCLLVIDVDTHLPIAARFVQRKQSSKKEWVVVIYDIMQVKKLRVFLVIHDSILLSCKSKSWMMAYSPSSHIIQGIQMYHSTSNIKWQTLFIRGRTQSPWTGENLTSSMISGTLLKIRTMSSNRWGLRTSTFEDGIQWSLKHTWFWFCGCDCHCMILKGSGL